MAVGMPPSFDRIAPLYRWLEYLAVGLLLERTRLQYLDRLPEQRHALILGDGDGRFIASLLRAHPRMQAEAVDSSPAMLRLLVKRVDPAHRGRLKIHQADARAFEPRTAPDLIVTHFFLDCLTNTETTALVADIAPVLAPGGLWLVSEFRIPPGPLAIPARLYIRSLYLAFRLLTGLRTTHLPDHECALRDAGLTLVARRFRLFGLLTSEIWQKPLVA
jgi:SAM-dependent methyltransferase